MRKLVAGIAVVGVVASALPHAAEADSAVTAIGIAAAAILGAGIIGDVSDSESIRIGSGNGDLPLVATLGGGYYDVIPDNEGDDGAGIFSAELRFNQEFWGIRPFIGAEMTTSAAFYGYGGLMADVYFGDHIVLSPSAAIGAYAQGDGRDLGGTLEFRTGVEAAYEFDSGMRVGVGFYHLSNAGIYEENPGIETLTLNLSIPLN